MGRGGGFYLATTLESAEGLANSTAVSTGENGPGEALIS